MIVLSKSAESANLVCKYRPSAPVLVVSADEKIVRGSCSQFAQYGLLKDVKDMSLEDFKKSGALEEALAYARERKLIEDKSKGIVLVAEQSEKHLIVSHV